MRRYFSRRTLILLLVAWTLLIAGSLAGYHVASRPEASPVARGGELVTASGCYACHGQSEDDPRPNRRQLASGAWRPKAIPTFWENGIDDPSVLIDWITHGCPEDERERHQRLLVQMPAYGDRFRSADEIEAMAAWILAEGLRRSDGLGNGDQAVAVPAVPPGGTWDDATVWVMGDRLARQHGCYTCHGELGQGGVHNLASFKGYIPGFFGRDFLELTDGGEPAEIRHWIDHGRGDAIERGWLGPVARRFFLRQAIGMPAYREQMSEEEKSLLVEYLLRLQARGPLGARDVQEIADQLGRAAADG